ncbi:IS630 family transposase, partial [Streptococcus suis]|nr:IS630 family transposase [Streptococcus suis]
EKIWAHINTHLRRVLPHCDTFLESLSACTCFS